MLLGKQGGTKLRLIATVGILAVYWFACRVIDPVSSIGGAVMAGKQLENSNMAAVQASVGVPFWHSLSGLVTLFMVIALCAVWGPIAIKNFKGTVAAMVLAMAASALLTSPAQAYYDTHNVAEAVGIPPNATAFWIPDQGDTISTQTQTDDAAFYNANKVAGKIFIIPHHIFKDSGGTAIWNMDFYVPDGRLILVDRTPYAREWTATPDTGTATLNQAFACQTDDGLNITSAVSIAVSISPQNAATYLYNFGVETPPGDPNDPAVIFTSSYHARSLTNVMDTVGHGLVEAAVCKSIGSRDFITANKDYNKIMDEVQVTAQAFLAQRGITVDYIGWAGTFTFDDDVQKAVNNHFVAQELSGDLDTLERASRVGAVQKWDGHLPASLTTVNSPSDISGLMGAMVGNVKAVPTPEKTR
jgi:hypothetical protein